MTWIKQNENSYIHDNAPFTLQLIGGTWFVIDSRDQSRAIPFSDIFNNPVFPIDLSNSDVIVKTLQSLGAIIGASIQSLGAIVGDSLSITNTVSGTHLRGEGANTPSSPAHSFKNEITSGFYRKSAGVMAFSSLNNEVLTIDSIPSTLCKAWVNFNGTTPTPSTIRGSKNVSSVTKNGTGLYTVNIDMDMPDANYARVVAANQIPLIDNSGTSTAGTVFIRTVNSSSINSDSDSVSVAVFR
jgi:hypothetical protein